MEQLDPRSILVRMPNWLGDAVMATPVLADLRRHWPKAKLTAMGISAVTTLLEHDPHIDELFTFHRPSGWVHRKHYRNILMPLRHGVYDLGILLTNSFSSSWWFWRGHVKNRVGFATNWRSPFLDLAIPYPSNKEEQHQVVTYKKLLEPLAIPLSNTEPKLYVTDKEKEEAQEFLGRYGIGPGNVVVGINPGAAYGSAKCWPPERFQEVTYHLLEKTDFFIVYFGDSAGAPLVEAICRNMPERVINLAGKTPLRQFMALIRCCSVFLTNDSGPMHVSAALRTPLLALFGSTNEVKTGPYKFGTVIHKHAPCSPCYLRTCPIDFRCMQEISSEEVFQSLMHLMQTSDTDAHG